MNISRLIAGLAILFLSTVSQADCLEDGKEAFEKVLISIYEELGSPVMTEELAEKIDKAIFLRPIEKQPAFARNANTSWSAFEESIIGGISCFIDGEMDTLRIRWTPDSDLEILDLDGVLESK